MLNIFDLSYEHQQAVESMKSQLLIAFAQRLGGRVVMPVSEVDGTGKFVLMFRVDDVKREFVFEVKEKE